MDDLEYADLLAHSLWTARQHGASQRRRRLVLWLAIILITIAFLVALPLPPAPYGQPPVVAP